MRKNAVLYAIGASLALGFTACGPVAGAGSGSTAGGELDSTFVTGEGFTGTVDKLLVQSDGKILVAGRMVSYDGVAIPQIARLSSTGTLDTSFQSAMAGGPNDQVSDVAVDGDGEIFLTGDFTSLSSSSLLRLGKLHTTGSLNGLFPSIATGGFNDIVYVLVRDTLGRLLLGGEFTQYQGTSAPKFARVDPSTGDLDSSFMSNIGTGFNLTPRAIHVSSDGSILVGGGFTRFQFANTRNRLIRFTNTGAEDATFYSTLTGTASSAANSGFDSDVKVIVQHSTDGGYLIGGSFRTLSGRSVNRIVKIGISGTPNEGFLTNIGSGPDGDVRAIAEDGSGNILLGGDFTSFDGVAAQRLVRLSREGIVDTTFAGHVASGFDGTVTSIVVQSDGKILVGGEFSSFKGTTAKRIARLR